MEGSFVQVVGSKRRCYPRVYMDRWEGTKLSYARFCLPHRFKRSLVAELGKKTFASIGYWSGGNCKMIFAGCVSRAHPNTKISYKGNFVNFNRRFTASGGPFETHHMHGDTYNNHWNCLAKVLKTENFYLRLPSEVKCPQCSTFFECGHGPKKFKDSDSD